MSELRERAAARAAIVADDVRYIKLGQGGRDEAECLETGWMRMGHLSGDAGYHELCLAGDWEGFQTLQQQREGKLPRVASNITGQVRAVYEDAGETLWFTFRGETLFWGFIDPTEPPLARPDGGSWRRMAGGWSAVDSEGQELRKDNLPGSITRTAGYQGTSCGLRDPAARAALIRRINAQRPPEEIAAERAREAYIETAIQLIRRLGPQDFELLVDLTFSTLGWRRQSAVGGAQKTKDISLRQPLTGERAMVQIKTSTNINEFEAYAKNFQEIGEFDRFFFVYHSGDLRGASLGSGEMLIGPDRLGALVVDAGLYDWVAGKVL